MNIGSAASVHGIRHSRAISLTALALVLSTPAYAALPTSLVSACSGVSLPRSVVTDIVRVPLNGIVSPLQGTVNNILGVSLINTVLGTTEGAPLSIDVDGILDTAAEGDNIRLSAVRTDGTILGAGATCNTTSDSIQLTAAKGISIGGGRLTGLGNDAVAVANAGTLDSIAFGNGATTTAAGTGAVALGNGAQVTAANSVAIGSGSTAERGALVGYDAPGLAATQTSAGEFSVGSPGAERQVTNVAAGSAPTDATNVAQLSAVQANAVGYNLDPNGVKLNSVTLTGGAAGPVALTNLADGALTPTSTDAVTGAQLAATNTIVNSAVNGGGIMYFRANSTLADAQAIGLDSVAIGANTVAATDNAVAIGTGALANGGQSVSIGAGNIATGNGAIAIGDPSTANGQGAIAEGFNSVATLGGTASGSAANGAVALGNTAIAGGQGAVSIGNATSAIGQSAVALGDAASANAPGGIAIGQNAVGGGADGIAIGSLASATTVGGVALGTGSIDKLASPTAGATIGGTAYAFAGAAPTAVVSIGAAGAERQLANVAAGQLSVTSTDGVNGSQLFATNTQVGINSNGIAALNAGTAGLVQQSTPSGPITVGAVTGGGELNVSGTAGPRVLSGVADGVAATDAATVGQVATVGAAATNSVRYDQDGIGNRLNSITLVGGGAGPVTMTNVAAGALAAGSTDAVNGSQLFGTNANLAALAATIDNGTVGLVRQTGGSPGAGQITIGGTTGGPSVSIAGTDGTRVLTGLAPGLGATDAATVGQLGLVTGGAFNAVNYDIDALGGRTNTVSLVGGAAGPVTVTNVAAGALTASSTDAVNGAQLFGTNAALTTQLTTLATGIDSGSIGLVRQVGGSPGAGQITVGGTTGGTSVSVGGTDGLRVLTGLAPGVGANDAATVGQLAAGSANAVNYDVGADGVRTNMLTLAGGASGPVGIANVADGALTATSTDAVNGRQLNATNAAVAGNTAAIGSTSATLAAVIAGQAGVMRADNSAGLAAPVASGANSAASGFGASATGAGALAMGSSSTAGGTGSLALGSGAIATGAGSVALGQNSSDGGAPNVVSVGSSGSERRVTNVAPGVNGTDAINLNQLQAATGGVTQALDGLSSQVAGIAFDLNRFKRRANAGTAGAMAVAALPQAFTPGAGMIAGSVGSWQNEVAFAVGASKILGDQTVVKAGATMSARGTGGFNAGVGYQF